MIAPSFGDDAANTAPDTATRGITYVVVEEGRPTETFVRREIAAGRAAGAIITVLSLRRPTGDTTRGVVYLSKVAIGRGLIAATLRRPGPVAKVLGRVILLARPRTVVPHLYAAVIGIAASEALPESSFVHAHFAWVSATAADALARLRGVPLGVMPHAYDIFEDRVMDRYLGDKLRRAALVVVESDAARRYVREHWNVDSAVVPMGVPASLVVKSVDRSPLDSNVVVSVGTLKAKKGHDILLRALGGLADVTAVIVGGGEERQRLLDLADHLGIAERVDFPGPVSEPQVWRYLDRATVFVLASRVTQSGDRDGVPNVLIEAMARGVPVVSTAVSGIPELLADGRGIVVPPERPDLLASAVADLLANPGLRQQLAERARSHVLERYTVETNWRRLSALIQAAGALPA